MEQIVTELKGTFAAVPPLTSFVRLVAAAVLGGALAQFPVGWLADRFDRRRVLIGVSAAAAGVSVTITLLGGSSETVIFAGSFAFGLVAFPIFSISSAHANDFAPPDQAVELAAGLMFLYGIGAIASPFVSSLLIAGFGPAGLFGLITVAHVGLILFGLVRMRARRTSPRQIDYRYIPRTSFLIGRLMGRRPDANGAGPQPPR